MTDADRARLARAEQHAAYGPAMRAEPNTWITSTSIMCLCMLVIDLAYLVWYPWERMSRMPSWFKPQLFVSFGPTIFMTVLTTILFVQSLGLAMLPTRRVLAIVLPGTPLPGQQRLRLATAAGVESERVCRRRAASQVRVNTIGTGEVGVALCKGDAILEWVPIPV